MSEITLARAYLELLAKRAKSRRSQASSLLSPPSHFSSSSSSALFSSSSSSFPPSSSSSLSSCSSSSSSPGIQESTRVDSDSSPPLSPGCSPRDVRKAHGKSSANRKKNNSSYDLSRFAEDIEELSDRSADINNESGSESNWSEFFELYNDDESWDDGWALVNQNRAAVPSMDARSGADKLADWKALPDITVDANFLERLASAKDSREHNSKKMENKTSEQQPREDRLHAIEVSECAICVQAFAEADRLKLLPCGHMFHSVCCMPWFSRKHTCPYCRGDIRVGKEKA